MGLIKSWALAIFLAATHISIGLIPAQDSQLLSSIIPGESAHAQTQAPPLGEEPPSTLTPSTNNPPLVDEPGSSTPQNPDGAQSGGTYKTCIEENGKTSFLVCPILDSVANIMSDAVTSIMRQFLEVEPLKFEGPIYDTWNGVRTLANIAFVLIFAIMIFSYILPFNLDAYTVKSLMPKLVAAAIFVQLSYVLSALIVDVGNVLGQGIGSVISSVANNGSAAPAEFTVDVLVENVTTVFGIATLAVLLVLAAPLAIPVALMVVIAVAAFIFTLAIRYFLIGMFIVVSPLAIAAWVLPNTEKYFSLWLNSFVKVSLMYPIIIGLLAIAGNVGGLIPLAANSAGNAGGSLAQDAATSLIKILVLVAAFGAITQSFKWAGGFMSSAGDAFEKLTKKGTGAIKDSQGYKDAKNKTKSRQLKRVDNIGDKLGGLTKSDNVAKRAAGKGMFHAGSLLFAGHSGSALGRQRDASKLVKTYKDELDDMKEANMMNQRRALMSYYGGDAQQRKESIEDLRKNGGESLLGYTRTFEGRQAMVRRLAENNLLGPGLGNAIQSFGHPEDYQMMLSENGKNIGKSPAQFTRFDRDIPNKINPLTNQPVVMGDINKGMAQSFIASLTPFKIAGDDFRIDNFSIGADTSSATAIRNSKQWAQILGEYLPHSVEDNFDPSDRRNFMGADKRAALLKVMARNQGEFISTQEGLAKYNEVLQMVQGNIAHHRDALHLLEQEDDWDDIRDTLDL